MEFREMKFAESEGVETCKVRRVAAYCRVSTQSELQETSFEAQVKFYTERIAQTDHWTLAGIYADEGITGTSGLRRKEFGRMIRDCEAGKIDYIITKSISRFARNTLDCITAVRHLQSLGVNVFFEENNLDTGQAYSEMLLTVLAAFAQEESRSISENVKWSIRRGFETGKDRWSRIYGYQKLGQQTYLIVPGEAEVVRSIFRAYEHGHSMADIAKMLEDNRVQTPRGKIHWKPAMVRSILDNVKYVGDIQLQKYYTEDHLSHACIRNQGECRSYYMKEHHRPIVDRVTFDRVQVIRGMKDCGQQHPQYPFSTMLLCPHCGTPLYQRKITMRSRSKGWNCERGQTACKGFLIRSRFVESGILEAYAKLNPTSILKQCACDNDERQRAAKTTLRLKRCYPAFTRVDYWWLDELVDHISFGLDAISGESDHSMTVHWRCGVVCRVEGLFDHPEREHPETMAAAYWSQAEKEESRDEDYSNTK